MTVTALIADDQALLRDAFRVLLESAPDVEVVGEAANGREVVELARTRRADVVLMDIRMPQMDGVTLLREIVRRWPDTAVVMVTAVAEVGLARAQACNSALRLVLTPFGLQSRSFHGGPAQRG